MPLFGDGDVCLCVSVRECVITQTATQSTPPQIPLDLAFTGEIDSAHE